MKIVIDEKIPFIRGAFEPWADVVYSPGRTIDATMVSDADALIVRTRTRCNRTLLKDSNIKIVASATIGFDHLDTSWLEKTGIRWVNAPGCNSGSVMQYITALLFFLARKHALDLRSLTLGIVGVGNVGSKVARAASSIGMRVLLNDPPRYRREGGSQFHPIEKLIAESDILTLHVPLTLDGNDRTRHLISGTNLSKLKRNSIIINSSRGEVVDNTALRDALNDRLILGAALDVWEGEPEADSRLLQLVDFATPHIAGYSVDGKANATVNSVREVAATLKIPLTQWTPALLPQPLEPLIDLTTHGNGADPLEIVAAAVRHTYPAEEDDRLFRANPAKFEYLRDNYRVRREFSSYRVKTTDREAVRILSDLGFQLTK
ncbi:MAG: 4-phosphoerythronate dehydrogenase [Bacteroidales bacterium]|jgi:erythronate-4-phosphate dehydrogenase|nr:4-phosphoerythronate dehydrogenase [Bacteroidales bacterium]